MKLFRNFFVSSLTANVIISYSNIKDENKDFVQYLIYWVAGTKLIFIMIGIVIIIFGNYNTQLFTVGAFIISILSFYWKLYPIVKKLDNKNMISPKGYSKGLNLMIAGMIIGFTIVLVISIIS